MCGKLCTLLTNATSPEASLFHAGSSLPCPEPLPAAIEGSVFGREDSGPIVPDAQHVAALTEEHAREVAALLTDLAYLGRCRTLGIEPKSGRHRVLQYALSVNRM